MKNPLYRSVALPDTHPLKDLSAVEYDQFAPLSREEKRVFVEGVQRWFRSLPGIPIRWDLNQMRCDIFFGLCTLEKYEREVFKYGPACYQFYELVR
jgi:hypothetical protein